MRCTECLQHKQIHRYLDYSGIVESGFCSSDCLEEYVSRLSFFKKVDFIAAEVHLRNEAVIHLFKGFIREQSALIGQKVVERILKDLDTMGEGNPIS